MSKAAPLPQAPAAKPGPLDRRDTAEGFGQDPHRLCDGADRDLELAIGRAVRAFPRQQGLTVADMASATGLSSCMLSKIENGITSPSLTTLQVLSHAFLTPITSFFRGFEERREVQHVRAGEHPETERRGTQSGHQHNFWAISVKARRAWLSSPI